LEGNAREYLWTMTRHVKHDPQKFIRELVHATFKDANGYVEGLNAQKLDLLIEKYTVKKVSIEHLRNQWRDINERLNGSLFSPSFQDSVNYKNSYRQISNAFNSIISAICEMEDCQNDQTSQEEDTESDVKSESESRVEPEEPVKEPETKLIIEKVKDDVGVIKTAIKSLAQASEQLNLDELAKDSKHAEKVINDLNKKCLVYTEDLMKDLLNLDQVVCSQEDKPLRKVQVNNIQDLLNDVDSIKQKLLGFQNELKRREQQQLEETKKKEIEQRKLEEERRQKELEEKKKELEEKKKEALNQAQEKEKPERLEQEREKKIPQNMWRSLKFNADFKINDFADRYVLRANIPRMKEEDIKISLSKNNDNITISGFREPTDAELQQMRKQLATERKRDIYGQYYPPNEDEVKHLLRLGAGRFGQFSETYSIDPNRVNVNDIQASYQGGVVQVVIPKYRQIRSPSHNYGRQRSPRNFFQDDDFFW